MCVFLPFFPRSIIFFPSSTLPDGFLFLFLVQMRSRAQHPIIRPLYVNSLRMLISHASSSSSSCSFAGNIHGVCLWRYGPMLLRVITRLSPALTDGLSPAYARLFSILFLISLFSHRHFPFSSSSSFFPHFPFILPLFVAFLYPFNFQTFISFLFDSQPRTVLFFIFTRTNSFFSQRFPDFFLVIRLIFLRQIDAKEIGAASAATLIGCSPCMTTPQ